MEGVYEKFSAKVQADENYEGKTVTAALLKIIKKETKAMMGK